MEKKKIGVWLPFRKGMVSVTYETPGALVEQVRNGFVQALAKHGQADIIEIGDFRRARIESGKPTLEGTNLEELDAFVWFGEIGRDVRREHNLEILRAIEKSATVINCTFGYETAMDKFLTSSFLSEKGVKVPKFMLVGRENSEAAAQVLKSWGSVLLKPRLGSYGIGIVKLDKPQDIVDFTDYCPSMLHFVEEFVPNDPASWIGVNVIGGKHAYSYRKGKESFHDGWKVFDRKSVGGKMILAKPTERQIEIALKVADMLRMDWVGVDMVTDAQGEHYVIDVNAFPGLYPEMFAQAGVDGPKMMSDAVFARLGI